MDERHHRLVAANAVRIRDMNNLIRTRLDEFLEAQPGDYAVMCECPVSECVEMIPLSRDDYDHARSDPTWFIILPEHLLPNTVSVLERRDDFWIVEMTGPGARVAEEST